MTQNTKNKQPGSLDNFCAEKLTTLESKSARRFFVETNRQAEAQTLRDDKTFISFSCNDYLDLSHHPKLIKAAQQAAADYGVGAGASRLVTGNHPLFGKLEGKLAGLKNTEDCLVFGSGYLANIGIIPAFAGAEDLLLIDELAHACINAGAQLAGARVIRFAHNDMADLEQHLTTHRANYRNCLILTDGVFSMDGDLAPLPHLRQMADTHNAWLMTDDAHGIGVIGGGHGSTHAFSPAVKVDIQMGTLSKAIGGYGGYVCASHHVCEFLRNRARSMVFSTGLPPMNIAAAMAALDVIAEDAELRDAPLRKARLFCNLVGLAEPQSPIVPVIFKTNEAVLVASTRLAEQGFLVVAIRPPTVPENTARLRIAFNANHKDTDIRRLAAGVNQARASLLKEDA